MSRSLSLLLLVLMLQGCASSVVRNPVPEQELARASISGIPDARLSLAAVTVYSDATDLKKFRDMSEKLEEITGGAQLHPNFLAISGGGAEGAFTAGLLNGWTAAGDRPIFQIVSGVSTGALIAPFAFLGPEYDEVLRMLYTTSNTDSIVHKLGIFSIRKKSALTDTAPLRDIIAASVDEEFLAKVAAEHDKGRRLVVATTNLDAQTPVVWNLGAIAKSGQPHALQLFRDVMLASASIPGVFPPVLIEVEANGRRYDEMHVDGGVSMQIFAYPPGMNIAELKEHSGLDLDLNLYMIRNSKVLPENQPIEMKLKDIAAVSASMLIRSQGNSNITETYEATQRDGIAFRLAYIPPDFEEVATEAFDPVYMNKLYQLAYERASGGYPWSDIPPWYSEAIREILYQRID